MPIDYSNLKPDDFLPKFGETCPKMEDLETGDLLFPRSPRDIDTSLSISKLFEDAAAELKGTEKDRTIRDILGVQVCEKFMSRAVNSTGSSDIFIGTLDLSGRMIEILSQPISSSNLMSLDKKWNTRLSQKPARKLTHIVAERIHALHELLGDYNVWGLGDRLKDKIAKIQDDPIFMEILFNTLQAAGFGKMMESWFGMTLHQFFWKVPQVKLLLDLLTVSDPRTNIFIGHVCIVIREENGQHVAAPNGKVYVIEDNITSYAHYRVAIHPYSVVDEFKKVTDHVNANLNGIRLGKDVNFAANVLTTGWANRRSALLEHVWHARPKITEPNGWQNILISEAKRLHGRPFGFMDKPVFGDTNRMYCAEYVYSVFRACDQNFGNKLKDKMTWGLMKEYVRLAAEKAKDKGNNNSVASALWRFMIEITANPDTYHKKDESEFFLLHPAMLWNSSLLEINDAVLKSTKHSNSYAEPIELPH